MKTLLITFLSLLINSAYAQWSNSGDNQTTGNLTIGGTINSGAIVSNGAFQSNANYGLILAPATGDAIIRRATSGSLLLSSGGGTSDIRFNYNYGGGTGGISLFDGGVTNNANFSVNSNGNLTISPSGGNVGIGIASPSQKLDIRGGALHVVNYSPGGYTFLGRNADPGNDSYFYHLISTNFHILGSSKNGTGAQRKLGFALGGNDTENDIKMTIDNSGSVGIGIQNPASQLHVASDNNHSINLSRANGTYGLRIFRNATEGAVYFQIGNNPNTWETKIKIGEGEGVNTKLLLNPDGGNVGIGTPNPDAKLAVNGQVHATEVRVTTTVPGPDYVFGKDYKLTSLEEIKNYIDQNKHLPEVPSAKEMEKNGVQLGEMNMLLLKKIEELTLYTIEMNKKLLELKNENETQQKEIEKLNCKR